jgi:asparaginyl-tRNA synthetase
MTRLETLKSLLQERYLKLRSSKMVAVLKVQDQLISSIRDFLRKDGFVEILAPIIGPVTDPGIRGAKQVSFSYYGVEFKVMSSMILYKQMIIASIPKVFSVSPNIRLEPLETVNTKRHLTEFRQVDIEQAFASYNDVMRLAEKMIRSVLKEIKTKCQVELEILERTLKMPAKPFRKYTYEEAVEIVNSLGFHVKYGEELNWKAEEALSKIHNEPFWIVDYPLTARGFYYLEHPDNPGILRDFDLLYPEGYGEAISGGERETRYSRVLERIQRGGEDPAKYGWYLKMLKDGIPPSAGFGIGVERLTRYICGLENIWDAVPFPKVAGIASP